MQADMVRAVVGGVRAGIRYRSSSGFGIPKLGPPEVTHILRKNELLLDLNGGPVNQLALNQLPSNNPIEDRLIVAQNKLTTGATFGVFDGHGGSRMAQVVSQRAPHYFALSVLPSQLLEDYVNSKNRPQLVKRIFSIDELNDWQYNCHLTSLKRFAEEILNSTEHLTTSELLCKSFEFLDSEISCEIQEKRDEEALTLAVQGCVATVAHITDQHLYVISTGDCRAVLGMCDDTGRWSARALNKEHNCDNVEELQRIIGEHPTGEKNTIIRNERLLGNLAPLRAFGDFHFKWSRDELNKFLVPLYGDRVIPHHYLTPPYLTARPEVSHHILTPRDKFLVIATDGLWEMLGTQKVVQFIGQFMQGIETANLLRTPENATLGSMQRLLSKRKMDLSQKPVDTNAATHLIRHALGRSEYGLDHSRLAAYLGLPVKLARSYRDDISILVIFFNPQNLKGS
ncbi:pyruvate dehydrogenase [acetyl-transferring]-phosphatase 2, mitochondrial-like isoform X1 [Varroa jacobsoni]|uniref:PPM-type phosphatase domain-containing protein n=1 Tax=Varroa destructor TaxID=109461 RepID=A0A7M7KA51_VARDE|nr:pyruvate dehydrogenase [acetyl-transferring]-phosphatase 2, mitochondrial-like isoform X2 [Varroa destructor]XP_022699245.1 pyruvate dehydrogenase [acetyl-transferring]-phosphatase 2, mitochondrial-like isoform X1 [Varroa jacobsoni]